MIQAHRTKRLRPLLAAGFASALFALPGWADGAHRNAATAASTTLSHETAYGSAEPMPMPMQKVGEARLKVLLWSVYDSRLYTPSGNYNDGDRPLRLEIQYLRDIEAQALIDRTLTEWEAMGRSHPNQQRWLQALAAMWPDIRSNDVLALELDQDSAATFRHNGRVIGRIEDPAFGQQFVDIWLSQDCTRPEMRLALLGRESTD